MKYKNKYNNKQKQNAYMNACDCLYFGYGTKHWNNCGLSKEESENIWDSAKVDLESL